MAHLLNDKWLDEQYLKALKDKSETDLERLRKAVNRLRWAELPTGSYDELKSVNESMVDNRIDNAIKDYRIQAKSLMLSDDLLSQALERYESTRQELKQHVSTVRNFIKEYPGVTIKLDKSGKAWLDDKQLDKFLTDKSTFSYNEVDKAYYTKLGKLVDALNELREFEDKNNLIPFSEFDTKNIYSGGIVNLYDRKAERYQLTRHLFKEMKDLHLILGHVMTPEERTQFVERTRQGKY